MARRRRSTRPKSSQRRYSGHESRNIGRERALQHIEEAHQLSRELGGSDRDVKQYFFSLPENELQEILTAYGDKYGEKAREYAKVALPMWRSGKRQMSGLVAGRLFNFLPPRMPPAAKYKLTQDLWHHVGPSSRKTLRVGLDANADDVVAAVGSHIDQTVVAYKIPESLERRFEWLSSGDVHVKQDLLNHLRHLEKDLVTEGVRMQLSIMLEHMSGSEGRHTNRLAQTLKLGKHEIELIVDPVFSGTRMEDPQKAPLTPSSSEASPWFWWILGLAVFYVLIFFAAG